MYGDWVCNPVYDRDSEDQTVTIRKTQKVLIMTRTIIF
jgi:hypothetical protein